MEQSQTYQSTSRAQDHATTRQLSEDEAVQSILGALEDPYCRRILEAMTGTFATAQQISQRCDMPISTTYRKLNTLVEVGLLDTSIQLRRSGHHTKEFALGFETVTVVMDEDESTRLDIAPLTGD